MCRSRVFHNDRNYGRKAFLLSGKEDAQPWRGCCSIKIKVKVPLDNFCPVLSDSRGLCSSHFPSHRVSVCPKTYCTCCILLLGRVSGTCNAELQSEVPLFRMSVTWPDSKQALPFYWPDQFVLKICHTSANLDTSLSLLVPLLYIDGTVSTSQELENEFSVDTENCLILIH